MAVVASIESDSVRVVTPCGTGSMVWRIWGEGPALVLLHGASGSWAHWIRNIRPLARHFRVLVPDMPGFGDSETLPEPHTAERLSELVATGLEVVVPAPAAIDVAGFSFGGIVGGLAAARLGHRVRTLVLLGTGGLAVPRAPIPPLRPVTPGMAPEEVRSAHRENLRTLMIADPARADDLAVHVQAESVRRARFKSGTIPSSDVLLRVLPAIQARIAGIWGGRDAFARERIEDYRRVLASAHPGLDFRVIDGAGHWVIYEAADRVNAALLEILRQGP